MGTVKGMFGSDVSMNHSCGFCRYHSCCLTAKQMKAKNCLGKQCWYLVKNEDHPYWTQRESMKQKRRDRKQMINEYVSAHTQIVV